MPSRHLPLELCAGCAIPSMPARGAAASSPRALCTPSSSSSFQPGCWPGSAEAGDPRALARHRAASACKQQIVSALLTHTTDKLLLPVQAVKAAQDAGKAPDTFYCLALLEETGILTVPGSGFGQAQGSFHLRTTILPPIEQMHKMVNLFQDFHKKCALALLAACAAVELHLARFAAGVQIGCSRRGGLESAWAVSLRRAPG